MNPPQIITWHPTAGVPNAVCPEHAFALTSVEGTRVGQAIKARRDGYAAITFQNFTDELIDGRDRGLSLANGIAALRAGAEAFAAAYDATGAPALAVVWGDGEKMGQRSSWWLQPPQVADVAADPLLPLLNRLLGMPLDAGRMLDWQPAGWTARIAYDAAYAAWVYRAIVRAVGPVFAAHWPGVVLTNWGDWPRTPADAAHAPDYNGWRYYARPSGLDAYVVPLYANVGQLAGQYPAAFPAGKDRPWNVVEYEANKHRAALRNACGVPVWGDVSTLAESHGWLTEAYAVEHHVRTLLRGNGSVSVFNPHDAGAVPADDARLAQAVESWARATGGRTDGVWLDGGLTPLASLGAGFVGTDTVVYPDGRRLTRVTLPPGKASGTAVIAGKAVTVKRQDATGAWVGN